MAKFKESKSLCGSKPVKIHSTVNKERFQVYYFIRESIPSKMKPTKLKNII